MTFSIEDVRSIDYSRHKIQMITYITYFGLAIM